MDDNVPAGKELAEARGADDPAGAIAVAVGTRVASARHLSTCFEGYAAEGISRGLFAASGAK